MSENGGAKLYRFAWLPLKYVLLNHYVFFYLRLSRRRSRNCRLFLLLNLLLLTNEFRKANRAKVSTPKGGRQGLLAMTKPLSRSDLASEAIWRRICLKKSGSSQSSNIEPKFAWKNPDYLLSTSFLLTTKQNLPEKIRMFFYQQIFF